MSKPTVKVPAGDLMRQGVYTAIGAGAVTLTGLLVLHLLTHRKKAENAGAAPGGCGCGCGGGK